MCSPLLNVAANIIPVRCQSFACAVDMNKYYISLFILNVSDTVAVAVKMT